MQFNVAILQVICLFLMLECAHGKGKNKPMGKTKKDKNKNEDKTKTKGMIFITKAARGSKYCFWLENLGPKI